MPIDFDTPSVRLDPLSVIAGAVLALLLWLAGFLSAALFQRLAQSQRPVAQPALAEDKSDGQQLVEQTQEVDTAAADSKHADDADLAFFKDTAEGVYTDILSSSSAPGGWTLTTDKKVDGVCIYRAFSRPLPNGTTVSKLLLAAWCAASYCSCVMCWVAHVGLCRHLGHVCAWTCAIGLLQQSRQRCS